MNMKKFILKTKFFFSRFRKHEGHEEKGFIYEFDDERFKDLPIEDQGVEGQKSWNKDMRER